MCIRDRMGNASSTIVEANDAPNGLLHFSFEISSAGILFHFFSDRGCHNAIGDSDIVPFGGCIQPPKFPFHVTVDAAQNLPSPVAGSVLAKVWYGSATCTGADPTYVLWPTSCYKTGPNAPDVEIVCGDGVEAQNKITILVHDSKDDTCSGKPTRAPGTGDIHNCTAVAGYGMETVWCGASCSTWKTLRARYPYCDPPRSGTDYAVDLATVLGPQCSSKEAGTAQCCYEPLGYEKGPPFGSDCKDVCGTNKASGQYRYGASEEYCGRSDGSHYGNCFCGPDVITKGWHEPK